MVQGSRQVMYLVDTVTISETAKSNPDPYVQEFLERVSDDELFISSVTVGEIYYGILLLPEGRRRIELQVWLDSIIDSFSGRILGPDKDVALMWAATRAEIRRQGQNIDFQDLLIAATALHHDLTVVTRNVRDFAPTGCKILNPWESAK